MALVDQSKQVMTSRGPRPVKDLLCYKCNERKPGVFTINSNGQQVCPDCSGSLGAGVIGLKDERPDDQGKS